MIADRQSDFDVQSTITGESIAMGIDQAAMAHIMNVLTDLYSDPELAVIREYSTNARDSHIEAGCPERPIEVNTPTAISPFLRIRDYGIGLSVEDIHAIYSQYGASTKRSSNDFNGMLGLGCKSALTYSAQFTVTSVKDGTRIQVIVSRDDNGSGSMTVADTSATDQPNGVEVSIAARTGNEIERKAREFFSYWPEGSVLLNGKQPERFTGLKITDAIYVCKAEGYRSYSEQGMGKIVMGGVPYPVKFETNLNSNYYLVSFVDIGKVNFTPSREALHMTDKTKQTITEIETQFRANVESAIQRKIDEAPNPIEALRARNRWQQILYRRGAQPWTYKGGPMPEDFQALNGRAVLVPGSSSVLSRHQSTGVVTSESWHDAIWVYNYDRPTFTAGQKKKMNYWAAEDFHTKHSNERIGHYVMMRGGKPADVAKWVPAHRFVDWKVIEAIKLPKLTSGGGKKTAGTYDCWIDGVRHCDFPADKIDTTKPIYYMTGSWHEGQTEVNVLKAFHSDSTDFTLVVTGVNRIEKFKRLFPMAKSAAETFNEAAERWQKGMSERERLAFALWDSRDTDEYLALDSTRVDDPELRSYIYAASCNIEEHKTTQRSLQRVVSWEKTHIGVDNILENRYPLFNTYALRSHPEHVYMYLNAAYAAHSDQKEDQ